jgi:hypothetical protein
MPADVGPYYPKDWQRPPAWGSQRLGGKHGKRQQKCTCKHTCEGHVNRSAHASTPVRDTHSPSRRHRTLSHTTSSSRNDGQPCTLDSFTNASNVRPRGAMKRAFPVTLANSAAGAYGAGDLGEILKTQPRERERERERERGHSVCQQKHRWPASSLARAAQPRHLPAQTALRRGELERSRPIVVGCLLGATHLSEPAGLLEIARVLGTVPVIVADLMQCSSQSHQALTRTPTDRQTDRQTETQTHAHTRTHTPCQTACNHTRTSGSSSQAFRSCRASSFS